LNTFGERLAGLAALAVAVAIWAGWIVVVRAAVEGGRGLTPLDLALMRYGVPALLLAPVWWGCGPWPKGLGAGRLAAMALGWGAPFVLLAGTGLRQADTALFAALVPGAMPLFLAAILAVAARQRPRGQAALGLGLIGAGAGAALVVAAVQGREMGGVPWLLAASAGWAAYAAAFRGTGLTPLQATAVVAFWSALGLAPFAFGPGVTLWRQPLAVIVEQVVVQGLVSGVLAVAAFAVALRALGTAPAAAGAAMVPVLAALGGWWFLGEPLSAAVLGGLAMTAAGVALVNLARKST
jgi:drug/metabolite transporter (DMT)-like permease